MPAKSTPHIALACEAMATRFEIVLYGKNLVSLRAAGEEALDEIQRLDKQLSMYNPASEIAHLNARAALEPVRVEPGLFQLLEQSQRLHEETNGAFDITIAPLLRCWGLMGGKGTVPTRSELAEARRNSGMNLVHLDSKNRTVRFEREGVMLDLGAIGKGYAVERAAELLREAGVTSAILHGGTSTVQAIGRPPDADAWKVAIEYPRHGRTASISPSSPREERVGRGLRRGATNKYAPPLPSPLIHRMKERENARSLRQARPRGPDAPSELISVVPLRDEALSVSAVWGKSFQTKGKTYGHVIDPRTGQPAADALLSAVGLPSATETDALSTALLVLGAEGHDTMAGLRDGMRTLVMQGGRGRSAFRVRTSGLDVRNAAAFTTDQHC